MDGQRAWILALFCAAAVAAGVFPQADLAVSGWFFQPGRGFLQTPFFDAVHKFLPNLLMAASAAAAAVLLYKKKLARKDAAFIAAVFAAGPGLLVNALLKEHYGRARPVQVEQFGGHAHFTSALQITDQCAHNCSFTAGDPSVGFALIAFALVLPQKRNGLTALALAAGAALGLLRIAQGGHFLSDVLFTGVVTLGCAFLLFSAWFGRGEQGVK